MNQYTYEAFMRLWPGDVPRPEEVVSHRLWELTMAYMDHMELCNFTAHRTFEQCTLRNVIDSVAPYLLGLMPLHGAMRYGDVGTGGGFPGVPLSAMVPRLHGEYFDSVAKKLAIIQKILACLDLPGTCHHGRLEDYGQDVHLRGHFDVITSRAVAKWYPLLELSLPLLKRGGSFYAYQTPSLEADIQASEGVIEALGGRLTGLFPYTCDGAPRLLVVIEKAHATPREYPRDPASIQRFPLSP